MIRVFTEKQKKTTRVIYKVVDSS